MNIRHTALATAICALTVSGCGTGHSTKPAQPAMAIDALPRTLVGEDYNSVTLIETDSQGTNVTGTFDTTEVEYNRPSHQRATVTGTVKGSQVALNVSFTLGSTVFNGTLNGSTLTLQVPQPNGQIEDYVLKPGTVAEYNQLVSQLETGGSPTPEPSTFY